MLPLTYTNTDSLELVTATAKTIDVTVNYTDCTTASPPVVSAPSRQLSAISTQTTTKILDTPANGYVRNVKSLYARNKDTTSCDITIQYDQNGTNVEIYKTTLNAGATLQYVNGKFSIKEGSSTGIILLAATSGDITTAADTNPVDVTNIVFTYVANAYYIMEIFGIYQAAANTTGFGLQWNVSTAVTTVTQTFYHQLANTGTLSGGSSIADDASVGVSSGFPTNATNVPIHGAGILIPGNNTGTCQLRLRSEVAAAATLKAGTIVRVERIA
jgi:hypothetical protein